ncbi:MAG: type 4a pilus biogenesis protein PilO [Gammaproteobacteria bacterium]
MTLDQLRDLDLRDINFSGAGDWPPVAKAIVAAIVLAAVLVAGYFLVVRDQFNTLNDARAQETTLRQQFEHKQRLAANVDAYKAQLAEMREKFGALLLQLPSKTEIESLLRDVSQTAQEDGLAQKLFQPQSEVHEDFYAEKPIRMEYVGSWQQIAKFVSDVSSLSRIVTLSNFSLHPTKAGVGAQLDFAVTGVTYRYLSGEEARAKKSKKHKR